MGLVLDEIIMDEHGESIGTRELINEIRRDHNQEKCIMREVIRLFDGRLVIDRVFAFIAAASGGDVSFRRFACYLMIGLVAGGLIWWGEQSTQLKDDKPRYEARQKIEESSSLSKDQIIVEEEDKPLFYLSIPFVSVGIL